MKKVDIFSRIYYLALVTSSEVLAQRLNNRPSWRESNSEVFINNMISFNSWFIENGPLNNPIIDTLDASNTTHYVTSIRIQAWLNEKINNV